MGSEVEISQLDIETREGICDAVLTQPKNGRKSPAVLFLMDGFGLRPYLTEMAARLAGAGYLVLQPNLLYRKKRSPILDINFPLKAADLPAARAQLMSLLKDYSHEKGVEDVEVFLNYLSKSDRFNGKIGVTGYCMGGSLGIRAAAAFPEKIQFAASFHGGNLATERSDSPHLLLPNIKAALYVAHADNDGSMPPEQIARFEEAVSATSLRAKVELYPGAAHGFTMADLPAYNAEALSRHWKELFHGLSQM